MFVMAFGKSYSSYTTHARAFFHSPPPTYQSQEATVNVIKEDDWHDNNKGQPYEYKRQSNP